jgi:hypothetical protein
VPCTITFVNVTTTVGARTGVTNQAEEVDWNDLFPLVVLDFFYIKPVNE